jgi:Brp/Blh family beta-carotene 15,15'-monooxygenase
VTKIIIFRIAIFTIFLTLSYLLSANYQDMIGFALVLSVGLIHGANDLLIIKKNSKNTSTISQFRTFFTYISVVFIGLIFFYLFPSFALITFILVSIYHFGEQHLEAIPINKSLKNNSRIMFRCQDRFNFSD